MSNDNHSNRYNLRSDIKGRPSIHENSPILESKVRSLSLNREREIGSKSPKLDTRKSRRSSDSPAEHNLYPELPESEIANHYPELPELADMNPKIRTNTPVESDNNKLPIESDTVSEGENDKFYKYSEKIKETPQNNNTVMIILIITVISLLLFNFLNNNQQLVEKSQNNNLNVSCAEFLDLAKKYPNQENRMFKSLKVSTEGLYNRREQKTHASVFAFFSTDQNILNDLTNSVVEITRKCINQTNKPIILTHLDLNKEKFLNDHSKIISEYIHELKKSKIMVINNLDALSTKILPSLHSFTDSYNPLVEKSIIYLTIKVPEKPSNKHADYIFEHLEEKWNDLKNNIRGPLITRLLEQNFFLEPSY